MNSGYSRKQNDLIEGMLNSYRYTGMTLISYWK